MKTLLDRLMAKAVPDASTGCLVWHGAVSDKGKWVYGLISSRVDGKRKLVMAHRAMYEIKAGAIPAGLELDHLCRNTRCINPDHLEPVTHAENIRRSINFQSSKTHCVNSHPLSGENLYVKPNGARQCRTCRKSQWDRYKERRAA